MAQFPVNYLCEDVLQCPICFDSIGKEPKTLRACGHTLCDHCYVKESLRRDVVTCPTCRTATYVGEGTRGGPVAINVMLKNVVEFIETHKETMKRLPCKLCDDVDVNEVLCEKCSKKESKKAELRAKPRYLYKYDNKSALDVVLSKRGKVSGKKSEENDKPSVKKTVKVKLEEKTIKKEENTESEVKDGEVKDTEEKPIDVLDQLDPECVVQ